MKLKSYKKTRSILFQLLWIVALLWLLTLMSMPTGHIPRWLFGVLTVGAFIAAWWINLRMTSMQNRAMAGRCWKCGYVLKGIESTHCPECGAECEPTVSVNTDRVLRTAK